MPENWRTRFQAQLVMVVTALVWSFPAGGQDSMRRLVTFRSLLSEMTDLSRLAQFPDPGYKCSQFSSYARRSVDRSVLTDENWFANDDTGKFLRFEERDGRKEYVLMDARGPGAIVRIWSADADDADDAGIIRIYFDHADTPTIKMQFMDMLNGKNWPFITPIAGVRARVWNSHFPLPYARHCKVTTDKNHFYYQINYRTYAEDVAVRTYEPTVAQKNRVIIEQVAARLEEPAAYSAQGGERGGAAAHRPRYRGGTQKP